MPKCVCFGVYSREFKTDINKPILRDKIFGIEETLVIVFI